MRQLVIIPTYNERDNVGPMVERVLSLDGTFDLLVIDDGSPDGTADIVRALQPRCGGRLHLVERSGKLGLGTAYIAGFRWALERGYDLVFEMDCDFSHDPADLARLAAETERGADVVVGSRYVRGGRVVNWPLSRLLISYGASLYVRIMTFMPVHDATAGFVCYTRRALGAIDFDEVRMKGYGFQIEMKYAAWRLGMRLREVPIVFTERRVGVSKMSGGIFGEAFFGVPKLPFRRFRRPTDR